MKRLLYCYPLSKSAKQMLLAAVAVLCCGSLAGCKPAEIPDASSQDSGSASLSSPAALREYPVEEIMETGQSALTYGDQWEFYIQYTPISDSRDGEVSVDLMCRELDTGLEWPLDRPEFHFPPAFQDFARLAPFTDVMGRDGFIFSCCGGLSAGITYDFYAADPTGASKIASCTGSVYLADLNGDGRDEMLSQHGAMGAVTLCWLEDGGIPRSCSLNDTARAFLGIPLESEDAVSLRIQDGTGLLEAFTSSNSDPQTLDISRLWEFEQTRTEFFDKYLLNVSPGRTLTLICRESRLQPDRPDYFAVDEILVYDGDKLLQTIDPDAISYDGDLLFEGLFVNRNGSMGAPDIRDFNFDGAQDFGLLAVEGYPHNVPYCYFLWDAEAGRFDFSFVQFAPLWLDEDAGQFVSMSQVENGLYWYDHYGYDEEGQPQLLRREEEDHLAHNTSQDHVWVNCYAVREGELIQIHRELRSLDWVQSQPWFEKNK